MPMTANRVLEMVGINQADTFVLGGKPYLWYEFKFRISQ